MDANISVNVALRKVFRKASEVNVSNRIDAANMPAALWFAYRLLLIFSIR